MREQQWEASFQQLIHGSRTAIEQFAAQYPTEVVCHFAYDSEPCYGYVLTCLNTDKANIKHVREMHERKVKYRQKLLAKPTWRNSAYYQVKANSVLPFCNNTGDFAYQGFTEIKFPEWQEFAQSCRYPKRSNHEDDYLESRVASIFARALDTLAEDGSFEKLRLASPTLLGFGFHDQVHNVVRMLRLPGD